MKIESLLEMMTRMKDMKKSIHKSVFAKNVYYYAPMITVPATQDTGTGFTTSDAGSV